MTKNYTSDLYEIKFLIETCTLSIQNKSHNYQTLMNIEIIEYVFVDRDSAQFYAIYIFFLLTKYHELRSLRSNCSIEQSTFEFLNIKTSTQYRFIIVIYHTTLWTDRIMKSIFAITTMQELHQSKLYQWVDCKVDTIDSADETLANVSEMKDVKCNNIYLNMLKLKIDFRKIRKHFVT